MSLDIVLARADSIHLIISRIADFYRKSPVREFFLHHPPAAYLADLYWVREKPNEGVEHKSLFYNRLVVFRVMVL